MYAVIEDSGTQFKVAEGETIDIDRRPVEPGDVVMFEKVLLVSTDEGATVGTPHVPDTRVVAEVVEHTKGAKITVLRFKRRKREHTKTGHRQQYTRVRIKEIVLPGQAGATTAAEEGNTDGA